MKNTCKRLLAAMLALLLVVCSLPVMEAQAAAKLKMSATSKSMYVGEMATLKVKNQPKGSTVTWSSSKKSVATISKKGVVKAVKAGSATVTCKVKTKAAKTAKAKTYTLKCKVTVKGTSKTVTTQSALKSALKNKKLTKITIKTDAARTFTVPAGTYSKVALAVDAPNADVVNNGVFKSITVKSIKPETFTEKAKGNKITVSAPNARLIVDEGAELSGVTVTTANANVAIVVKGSVDAVAVNAAATVSVQADGEVGAVNVEAAAALNITGTAKEIAVTITADAAGATLTTAVTAKVEAAANAKIELTAGAEGSTVKTTDTSASVDVKNDTTAKVDVTTPAGTQSVDAGREQTVTDSTSGGGPTGDGSADSTNSSTGGSTNNPTGGSTSGPTGDNAETAYDNNIIIWVAEEALEFTSQKVEEFINSDEAYSEYTVTVEPVGEGDAARNMLTDVESGADIYGFAQDQLPGLVSAGALQPINGEYQSWIAENNDQASLRAAQAGNMTYAFPVTSDNGYLLFYDKSVITDPASLEQIVADCETAGKNFYFDITAGFYQPAFFFGTGCIFTYDTDADGNYTACNMDYNSDKGLVALKEMIELVGSSSFQNGSSSDDATNYAAIVTGTWAVESIQQEFGDNYACAKLPAFTGSDGNTYQMGGFGGFELIGIKPQKEEGKLALCCKLAQYLTSEEVQLARYEALGWGPSNKMAQDSDVVKADEALVALQEQLAFSVPQGNTPIDYWTLARTLGNKVISGELNESSDETLRQTLEEFQNACMSYVQ